MWNYHTEWLKTEIYIILLQINTSILIAKIIVLALSV